MFIKVINRRVILKSGTDSIYKNPERVLNFEAKDAT